MLDILELSKKKNPFGATKAHELAKKGFNFPLDRLDILSISDDLGWSVAHEMAHQKYQFPLDRMDILKISNKVGWSVAHEMARQKFQFPLDRMDILTISNNNGWSVAHEMAYNSTLLPISTNKKQILKIKDNIQDWTVAHQLAKSGYIFPLTDFEILFLTDKKFFTVLSLMDIFSHDNHEYPILDDFDISDIKNAFFKVKIILKKENFSSLDNKEIEIIYRLFQKYYKSEEKSEFYKAFLNEYNARKIKKEIFDF